MTRPRLLDLFCGAGGAAMGYHRAGFDVTGVDVKPQPRYPFAFVQADAMTYPLDGFDAIHASPPCQDHMRGGNKPMHGTGWMLEATRSRLLSSGVPWIIENVPGAPMRADFQVCGCMFGLHLGDMQLVRQRWFETSWDGFDMRPPCYHGGRVAVSVVGTGTTSHARDSLGYCPTRRDYQQLMGIDWMQRPELSQAIPPAYTEYVGRFLMRQIKVIEPMITQSDSRV
jgi:DNA (cytosine-5)-methyltransferase 1